MADVELLNVEADAEILDALSSEKRLKTFLFLVNGRRPKEIADELDVTRSAVQPYLTDLKDTGLVEITGKDYNVTEKGREVAEILVEIDELHAAESIGKTVTRVLQNFFGDTDEPVSQVIDPEALDQLLGGDTEAGGRFSFTFEDTEITVHSDGTVEVQVPEDHDRYSEGTYQADIGGGQTEFEKVDT